MFSSWFSQLSATRGSELTHEGCGDLAPGATREATLAYRTVGTHLKFLSRRFILKKKDRLYSEADVDELKETEKESWRGADFVEDRTERKHEEKCMFFQKELGLRPH